MERKNSIERISLAKYWEGVHSALDARLKVAKDYIKHPATGISAEKYFLDLLQQYLPKRYIAASGFAVDSSGRRSDNMDILVVDTFHIPPLCSEPNFKVFAIESICAAIEVTTGPKAKVKRGAQKVPKFEVDLEKLAKIRSMGRYRKYVDMVPLSRHGILEFRQVEIPIDLCPRSYIITSGDEWNNAKTYQKNLLDSLTSVKARNPDTWLNAVLSLKHGMLHFAPYTDFESRWIRDNPLLEFLLFLSDAISTFHTFKIDIRKYRPTIPETEAGKPLKHGKG